MTRDTSHDPTQQREHGDRQTSRRSCLKAIAAGTAFVGATGSATAGRAPADDELRLFSEVAIPGTTEIVTQGNYAYVAINQPDDPRMLVVVDLSDPNRPEIVATRSVDAFPDTGTQDVKVDGDLLGLSSNNAPPGGVAFFDVSNPADPTLESVYKTSPRFGTHNHFVADDHAYLCYNEPRFVNEDGDENIGVRIFGNAGVKIVDASDPGNPVKVGEWLLKSEFPDLADSAVNQLHDIYVQDGLAYCAFWDAGIVILDVSDPTDPQFVTQFGEAADIRPVRPFEPAEEGPFEYAFDVGAFPRYQFPPGNAHFVQPSPDGDHVYVGGESFGFFGIKPREAVPSGIEVWNVTDFDAPEKVATIDPPDVDAFRTAHNFDVTANRLHTSWYAGGIREFDITDPTDPTETAHYDPEGYSFWTAVLSRGFIVGSAIGGGLVLLHDDRGQLEPPSFTADASHHNPTRSYVEPLDDDE